MVDGRDARLDHDVTDRDGGDGGEWPCEEGQEGEDEHVGVHRGGEDGVDSTVLDGGAWW